MAAEKSEDATRKSASSHSVTSNYSAYLRTGSALFKLLVLTQEKL